MSRHDPAFPNNTHPSQHAEYGCGLTKLEYAAIQIMSSMNRIYDVCNVEITQEIAVKRAKSLFDNLEKEHERQMQMG